MNDWLLERWQPHDRRLRIAITVPVLDVEAAVREIERVAAHPAVVAVLLPVRGDARWGHVTNRPCCAPRPSTASWSPCTRGAAAATRRRPAG